MVKGVSFSHTWDECIIIIIIIIIIIGLFLTSLLQFLGAFAKFLKTTLSFVMYVCLSFRPSVRMEQLDSHWKYFREIWYLNIFQKSIENIQD